MTLETIQFIFNLAVLSFNNRKGIYLTRASNLKKMKYNNYLDSNKLTLLETIPSNNS